MTDQPKRKRGRPPVPAASKKRRNFTLRGSDEFYAKLAAACAASGRGMAEEIIARVERTFAHDDLLRMADSTGDIATPLSRAVQLPFFKKEGE